MSANETVLPDRVLSVLMDLGPLVDLNDSVIMVDTLNLNCRFKSDRLLKCNVVNFPPEINVQCPNA